MGKDLVFIDEVHLHVGQKILCRRKELGLSLDDMARKLAISQQLMRKLESGNRYISASRLYDICAILRVPPSYFFDGISDDIVVARRVSRSQNTQSKLKKENNNKDLVSRRESCEIIENYWALPAEWRKCISELVQVIADPVP